jgi:hypothetical protein
MICLNVKNVMFFVNVVNQMYQTKTVQFVIKEFVFANVQIVVKDVINFHANLACLCATFARKFFAKNV